MPRVPDVLALGALSVATAVGAAVHHRLPVRVATHFDLHGVADGWMPRTAAVVVLPAIGLATWALLRFAPRILPASEQRRLGDGVMPVVAALTAGFVASVQVALLAVALVPGFTITRGIWAAVGVLFVALGLLMPRVRRNALVGVRTPWTLTSDENWARTHRVAGYTMVLAGVASAFAGTFGGASGGAFAVASLVAGGLVPVAYSLLLARRQDELR